MIAAANWGDDLWTEVHHDNAIRRMSTGVGAVYVTSYGNVPNRHPAIHPCEFTCSLVRCMRAGEDLGMPLDCRLSMVYERAYEIA